MKTVLVQELLFHLSTQDSIRGGATLKITCWRHLYEQKNICRIHRVYSARRNALHSYWM